ncbi:sigma 54-interacting transcriptional regulator [Thiomicrospira microaerophila]|uniref:sigma 54-interacting transcriptional regulator n=1 Tax=Thiomicrospira microaerophila TaxID=406020 RepID=UPI0005CAE19F|nr:sigma-54 dependent transcriptional regulator [Thiomicrospira microaerophila]
MKKLLMSWIGEADLKQFESGNVGPVESFIDQVAEWNDKIFILYAYPTERVHPFLLHLSKVAKHKLIQPVEIGLNDPTSYAEVFPIVDKLLESVRHTAEHKSAQLNIFLSPGTPTMQAVWVLLSKTKYPAVCWSGYKSRCSVVELPFHIELEYLEQANEQVDISLENALEDKAFIKNFETIVGESPIIKTQIQRAKQLAKRAVSVLILGPTGSGKEVFAQAIHNASAQSKGEFVAVNCGALPSELAESILFGHVKGAFTGAVNDQAGLIKQADHGTLFLDEIGELPLNLQVKLLRVLQEKTFRPLGAKKDEVSQFRLIAATHQDLMEQVEIGAFREDLFYRIAIGILKLPSLVEREDDSVLIAEWLLKQINLELADQPGYVSKKFNQNVKKIIRNHSWLGNVRELRATVLRICAWSEKKEINAEDFEQAILVRKSKSRSWFESNTSQGIDLELILNDVQKFYIKEASRITAGQITKMAALLGFKNHQTLKKRMENLGL